MPNSISPKNFNAAEFQDIPYLQKIADLSPYILYVVELQVQRIIYINQNGKDLLFPDIKSNEAPKAFESIIHPDDYERHLENIEHFKELVNEEETIIELRFKTKNEKWEWFKITTKILETNDVGAVTKIIGTAQMKDSTLISEAETNISLNEFTKHSNTNKDTKALLQSVFDASPNSIVLYKTIYDENGNVEDFEFVMINSYTFNTTGRERDLIGKKLSKEFPTAIRAGIYYQFKKTAETGEPADFEAWYDGEGLRKWFHFRTERLNDLIVVTSEDITDRKKADETLRQMLNGSFSAISMLDCEHDDQEKIIDFIYKGGNKAAEAINNLPTQDLLGNRLLELFPGIEDTYFETFVKVVETGEPFRTQILYQHENYNHWLDVSAAKNGNGIILTYHDITEQKKAEQELIQLKEEFAKKATDKYSKIINSMDEGFCILEIIRDKSGTCIDYRYLEVNPVFEAQTGLKNVQGKTVNELVPNLENYWKEIYGKVALTGDSVRFEDYAEGLNRWFDVNAFRIDAPNEQHVALMFKDITERKEAQERQTFLLKLTDSLGPLFDPQETKTEAMRLVGQHFETERAFYYEIDENGWATTSKGFSADGNSLPQKFPVSDFGELWLDAFRKSESIAIGNIAEDDRFTKEDKNVWMESGLSGGLAIPLVKDGKLIAVLGLNNIKPRTWSMHEIKLLEEVAERTWAAVERAKIEKELKEAKERLSITLDAAQMGAWVVDLISNNTERNFRHDQIFGYNSPQPEWNIEIAKKHVLREDHQIFDDAFASAFKTGKLSVEVRVRWQDGSIHWMEVNGHIYFDEDGRPYRAAGINFEVTERRQAEEALRESEQRFRNLVEASALAVWETNSEGLIILDSPSWRNFTGQTIDEWKGLGWSNALHPEDREAVLNDWKTTVKSGKNFNYEFRLRSKDGTYCWTNVKAIPILDLKGNILKWSGMNLDIHEHKTAQESLKKAKEEAEEASRAKEDFVSTMSHEIRTPLNAIIGLTNLLMEQEPREDQQENLSSLSFSAKNLLVLINDILDFSKLEAGKMELAENPFNLHDLLSNLQKAHQPQAMANGTEISLQLEKNISPIIATDQVKLSQILHNLVSNAVKFTKRGQVTISVVLNRKDKDLLWLDFAVKDTGIGIAADKADHIFDKFAQAESSTVRNYGGTGLGLSITKLLLHILGSEIKLKSNIGEGSNFYFTLPVKIGKKEYTPVDLNLISEEKRNLSHLRLLLVEDVEINRNIIMQFLQNWWLLQPDEATNGKEAVEKARNVQYDIILMDVRMPEMDGYEATRQIRKIPGYQKTPILALTADKNQEVQQALHATQFTDMLTKPFEPRDLKQRILHHLSISKKDLRDTNGTFFSTRAEENKQEEDVPKNDGEFKKSPGDLQKASVEPIVDLSRYQKVSGGNREIFEKLIRNALKAIETYKEEFTTAAKEKDQKKLSDLIHKNTTSIHYIQANKLAEKIEKFRDQTKNFTADKDNLNEIKGSILSEFDKVIEGLKLVKK